jgi:phosphoribosylformylglycinamidine (FGAM) synthase-like enzyme
MARRCTICDHPQRLAIDRALLRGEGGFRVIAKRFGTSPSALYRHRHSHLVEMLAHGLAASEAPELYAGELARQQRAVEAEKSDRAIDAVAQLRAINAACLEVLKQARADSKPSILLRAVDRIVRQIELQARLLGEIQEGPTINVAVLPEWHGIRQRLLEALRPYPEARLAVVEALKGSLG